jgi:integrase
MPKITKRFVESIVPDASKILKHWDTDLKGFGVLVLPSGRCTYCVKYRNANRMQKHLKIGVHGHINTEEARTLAKQYLGGIAHGEDPVLSKKRYKELPVMKILAQEYLDRHVSRKREKSSQEDKRLIEKHILPIFSNRQLVGISRREVENLHHDLKKTPYQANRILALLSKMFSLAIAWEWCTDNPVIGIERYQEEKRDRWLNKEELGRFWAILELYPNHLPAIALKLLVLTGARKNEVLASKWDQFDLTSGVWTKPSHMTKQKKKEHLPLSEQALTALSHLKTLNTNNSEYLFPSHIGNKPLQEIKRFWWKVTKEANLENVRIHDLRHTHASHLVSRGLSLSIVGKLLGHTQASTTQRYAHLADEALRSAAQLFGDQVKGDNH